MHQDFTAKKLASSCEPKSSEKYKQWKKWT